MSTQSEYKLRLRQIIERECDGSRMNDTKWMEMLDVLRDLWLWRRVKRLDSTKVSDWTRHIQGGFSSHLPIPYIEGPSSPDIVLAVEWMEIDPIGAADKVDYRQEIEKRLESVNVPYTWEGSAIRVTGHIRKNNPPALKGRAIVE